MSLTVPALLVIPHATGEVVVKMQLIDVKDDMKGLRSDVSKERRRWAFVDNGRSELVGEVRSGSSRQAQRKRRCLLVRL